MALTEKGHVFAWGLGEYGALGTGFDQNLFEPVCITERINEKFIQISAGAHHSGFVTENGNLYFCGDNSFG